MIRSRASASCISAIGRSNARNSSAWSAHGIGAIRAARHRAPVRRRIDAARPGELEGGVHPERAVEVEVQLGLRHRLDEAAAGLGLAVDRRRVTVRCYDSRASDARALRGRRSRRLRSRHRPCARSSSPSPGSPRSSSSRSVRQGSWRAWTPPPTAGSRPWLTARDDLVVGEQLDAIAADLQLVSDRLDALGVQGRAALSALVGNDAATAAAALDEGDRLVADIQARSAEVRDRARRGPAHRHAGGCVPARGRGS